MYIWRITCANRECGKETLVYEIANLVDPTKGHLDEQGRFRCLWCNGRGYIVDFNIRDRIGEDISPIKSHLLGVIRPVSFEECTNHPVAFLRSSDPDDPPGDIWLPDFSNQKDGLLPPVFTAWGIVDLLKKLVRIGFFDEDKLIDAIREVRTDDG